MFVHRSRIVFVVTLLARTFDQPKQALENFVFVNVIDIELIHTANVGAFDFRF